MSIIALRRPSTSIPLWLFLIFFIFRFIYSILYILHTLISEIQVHTCLTVQNHSEIASKFTWTLASSQKSYFVSNWLARTRIHSHLLRLHSHLYSSSRTHSHTANIPLHLFHPHSSYTPQTSEGSILLSHILNHLFYGVFIWFDSDLLGIVSIFCVNAFEVSINWVSKLMWNLDIKGNSFNSEMPFPQSKTPHNAFAQNKNAVLYIDIVSVHRNSHNFSRPVECVMNLLRACFYQFPMYILVSEALWLWLL